MQKFTSTAKYFISLIVYNIKKKQNAAEVSNKKKD